MTTVDTSALATTAASSAAAPATGLNQLDNSQTFLQLLVAQLQNQDPDNPEDPSTFMTEIAQMTEVQSQTSLSSEEQTVAANSMIGFNVVGNSANGTTVSGTVAGVLLSSTGAPELQVVESDGTSADMSLTGVSEVTLIPQSNSPKAGG
jgi:flagellar basal-body rod modification protein FlgD